MGKTYHKQRRYFDDDFEYNEKNENNKLRDRREKKKLKNQLKSKSFDHQDDD